MGEAAMNLHDLPARDDQLTELLAACDDALALGNETEPSPVAEEPTQLQTKLAGDIAWCRFVRRPLTRATSTTLPGPTLAASLPEGNPGSAATPPLTQLGRFQIRRELGRGGC